MLAHKICGERFNVGTKRSGTQLLASSHARFSSPGRRRDETQIRQNGVSGLGTHPHWRDKDHVAENDAKSCDVPVATLQDPFGRLMSPTKVEIGASSNMVEV